MQFDILSDLIITKVYSATTMYTEKIRKLKEIIVQTGQLLSNMNVKPRMFPEENPISQTYTILLFYQRAVLLNGTAPLPIYIICK